MIECHNQKCKHHERWFLKEESGPYCQTFDIEPDCPPTEEELRIEKIKYLEELLEDFAIEGKRLVDSTLSAEVLPCNEKLKNARNNMKRLISEWENR